MPSPLDHGTISGPRTRGEARSPSTTTASTGPPGARAHAAAPAFPPLPPLVDTRTSVLFSVRPVNSRASSAERGRSGQVGRRGRMQRIAVREHDDAAVGHPPRARRSRPACGGCRPRCWPREAPDDRLHPGGAERADDASRHAAVARASGPPLRKRGGERSQAGPGPSNARAPMKASGARLVPEPGGGSCSEKAAMISANAAGTNAARYTAGRAWMESMGWGVGREPSCPLRQRRCRV